jgi:hypothetical protein
MRRLTTVLAAGCVDRGALTRLSRSGAFCSSSQAGTGAAGTRIDPTVGVELVSLVLADAALVRQHPDEWTSVQVLAMASVLLLCLATPFALPTVDVSTALCQAALALLGLEDRAEADRLAEVARQMLAQHLVDSYLAVPLQPGGRWTLRDWLVMLTRLFRPPDPFEGPDGTILDGSHIHRTANGEMVISKSEVIVANTLRSLAVEYLYEQPLIMPDGTHRLPDFTIPRLGKPTVYLEHLGMLGKAGYRANWEAKRAWYATHGILPWTDGGRA